MILRIVRGTSRNSRIRQHGNRSKQLCMLYGKRYTRVSAYTVYRYRSRDHSRPRVYKSLSCVSRDPGPFPFVMEKKEKEEEKEKVRPGPWRHRRLCPVASSPALFLQRVTLTSLSRHAAFILVRARAPSHRPLYISADLNLTVIAIVRTRASGPARPPACLHFSFLLFRNGIIRTTIRLPLLHSLLLEIRWCDATMRRVLYVYINS